MLVIDDSLLTVGSRLGYLLNDETRDGVVSRRYRICSVGLFTWTNQELDVMRASGESGVVAWSVADPTDSRGSPQVKDSSFRDA